MTVAPTNAVHLEDLQALRRKVSSRTFAVAEALMKIRSAPQAVHGFPDLERLLWLDVGLMAETLDLRRAGGLHAPVLQELARRKIIDYQWGHLGKQPAVGFRFRPLKDWDTLERDVGAWPIPGDRIVRPVLDRPDRQVVKGGVEDACTYENPNGSCVVWCWVGSKYPAVQHRAHIASREEWASWVKTAISVTRASDELTMSEEAMNGENARV